MGKLRSTTGGNNDLLEDWLCIPRRGIHIDQTYVQAIEKAVEALPVQEVQTLAPHVNDEQRIQASPFRKTGRET